MRFRAVSTTTLKDVAASSLRKAIFEGSLVPGERIDVAAVAGRLGVGGDVVRKALVSLTREGLVERVRNRGTVVAPLSRKDVEEIFSLRSMFEVQAVRLAVRHATKENLAQLRKNTRDTETAPSPSEVIELDLRFHELLMRSTNHRRLAFAWSTLLPQIRMFLVQANLEDPEFTAHAVQNHRALLDAICARQEARAVSLMEQQMADICRWIADRFDHRPGTSGRARRQILSRRGRKRKQPAG